MHHPNIPHLACWKTLCVLSRASSNAVLVTSTVSDLLQPLGNSWHGVVPNLHTGMCKHCRLLHDLKDVEKLSELGVLFLLFEMGLELSIDRLKVMAQASWTHQWPAEGSHDVGWLPLFWSAYPALMFVDRK